MAERRGAKTGRKFTDLEEILQHNTKESLWLLIHNKVYDVTNFKHPGGKQILLQNAGQDASYQFDDIGHQNADKHMPDLCIGYFEPENVDSRAGILEKKEERDGGDDLMSRALLAFMMLAVILFVYTQIA